MTDIAVEARASWGRKVLISVATYAGPLSLLWFGVILYRSGEPQNIATFVLWGTLDFIFAWNLYTQDSMREAKFSAAYGTIALVVVGVIYQNRTWSLGFEEYACTVGVVAAVVLWKTLRNPNWALLAAALSMEIGGIPVLIDSFEHPMLWTLGLWGTCAASAVVLYATAPSRSLKELEKWLFSGTSALFNSLMVIVIVASSLS